mmetsp:Transcript_15763/g.37037  ORF Transcript_15763/g.37037 Transcript_15763/m.37037 type:complete len:233 (+) Transcript_15763:1915-2613(+)
MHPTLRVAVPLGLGADRSDGAALKLVTRATRSPTLKGIAAFRFLSSFNSSSARDALRRNFDTHEVMPNLSLLLLFMTVEALFTERGVENVVLCGCVGEAFEPRVEADNRLRDCCPKLTLERRPPRRKSTRFSLLEIRRGALWLPAEVTCWRRLSPDASAKASSILCFLVITSTTLSVLTTVSADLPRPPPRRTIGMISQLPQQMMYQLLTSSAPLTRSSPALIVFFRKCLTS